MIAPLLRLVIVVLSVRVEQAAVGGAAALQMIWPSLVKPEINCPLGQLLPSRPTIPGSPAARHRPSDRWRPANHSGP